MAVGIRHAHHVAPSILKKLALTLLTSGDRSVGIVRLRTEATEFFLLFILFNSLVFFLVCIVSCFASFTRANSVIRLWAVELALK
jgi:hypothetical protein